MRVIVSPTAEAHIRAIDAWWREHRSAAPDLFREEFAAALQMLSAMPWIGKIHPHASEKGVRRVCLRATRYHIYYRSRADVLEIVAVWSSIRGAGPDLARIS